MERNEESEQSFSEDQLYILHQAADILSVPVVDLADRLKGVGNTVISNEHHKSCEVEEISAPKSYHWSSDGFANESLSVINPLEPPLNEQPARPVDSTLEMTHNFASSDTLWPSEGSNDPPKDGKASTSEVALPLPFSIQAVWDDPSFFSAPLIGSPKPSNNKAGADPAGEVSAYNVGSSVGSQNDVYRAPSAATAISDSSSSWVALTPQSNNDWMQPSDRSRSSFTPQDVGNQFRTAALHGPCSYVWEIPPLVGSCTRIIRFPLIY